MNGVKGIQRIAAVPFRVPKVVGLQRNWPLSEDPRPRLTVARFDITLKVQLFESY